MADRERRERELNEADRPFVPEDRDDGGPASERPTGEAREPQADAAEDAARTLPQSPASPAPAKGAEPGSAASREDAAADAPGRPGASGRGAATAPAARDPAAAERARRALLRPARRRLREGGIAGLLFAASAISIATTIGIVAVLVTEAAGFFTEVSIGEFLTGTRWAPLLRPQSFGILPLLLGSVQIAFGAAVIALPLGLASAIYLSEYAPERVRRIVKPILEILAGVPTVVYGYFALTFVTPILQGLWDGVNIFNAASASIVVGIMIIPMVSSLSEDALNAVPRSLREGAYALGATKYEVATRTVVPAALSGILASFILAISRAIGETMAVTIAAGATPKLTLNPGESIQTMTAYIVQVSLGETPFGTIEYRTIFAVGLVLFLMTLAMNIASVFILKRFREAYE